MNKYKFEYKHGYNYYIVTANSINDGLKVIEKHLTEKYPNQRHYLYKHDFDITKLEFNYIDKPNSVLHSATKDEIELRQMIKQQEIFRNTIPREYGMY